MRTILPHRAEFLGNVHAPGEFRNAMKASTQF
jgi:hypothetical protein